MQTPSNGTSIYYSQKIMTILLQRNCKRWKFRLQGRLSINKIVKRSSLCISPRNLSWKDQGKNQDLGRDHGTRTKERSGLFMKNASR